MKLPRDIGEWIWLRSGVFQKEDTAFFTDTVCQMTAGI